LQSKVRPGDCREVPKKPAFIREIAVTILEQALLMSVGAKLATKADNKDSRLSNGDCHVSLDRGSYQNDVSAVSANVITSNDICGVVSSG